jgi:TATA-box binding protein (TBP) (component of TFIID and TFIIIB)
MTRRVPIARGKVRVPYQPRATNTVVTAKLTCTFDHKQLRDLAYELKGRYDGLHFPPVVVRLTQPNMTIELFQNGRIVACGAANIDFSITGIHLIRARISKWLGSMVMVYNIDVQNLVVSAGTPYELDIARFHRDHLGRENYTTYNPGVFPGCHLFEAIPGKRRRCMILFTNALLSTGHTTVDEALAAIECLPLPHYRIGAKSTTTVPPPSSSSSSTERHDHWKKIPLVP